MAAGGHFEKFQMAISQRRVVRSTLCLVLWWGFRGRQITISGCIRQPFCKFTWPYLSTAFSDSLYVCTQTILCPRTL